MFKFKLIYRQILEVFKYRKKQKTKKQKLYFEAISTILYFSIQKADEPLARKLLEFYFNAFIEYRIGKENQVIVYPQEYYDAIFEANGQLCMTKRRPISNFNDSTLFALFLDEYQNTKISSTTYYFLWKLIIQSLYYEREDFVFDYWKKAHQLFNLFLKPAEKVHNDKWEVTNQDEIDEKEKEREEFLEFHYALGGYLMFLGKFELLKKITNWTNQMPPKYVLVPETMNEVIERYMKISIIGGYTNPVYLEQKYPFPDISGVNANDIIQMWIKRYLSILFLRQFTLHSYYSFSDPLKMPHSPKDLPSMKLWEEELVSLKIFINEYLSNKDLLQKIGLLELYDKDWFAKNNKEEPNTLIEELNDQIKFEYGKTKKEQKVDAEIERLFQDITRKNILSVYDKYSEIFNKNIFNKNFKSFFISGHFEIMDKAGFVKNQEIGYLNSDSAVSEMVAVEFGNSMLNAFVFMNKTKYILKDENLFYAIDKLFDENKNDYLIVSIGLNLNYFLEQLKIKGLTNKDGNWFYNNIKIIDIYNTMNTIVSQSLFVIRKIDLPAIEYLELDPKLKAKFKLDEIETTKHIYTKILNLNEEENETIRSEIAQKFGDKDFSEKVLVCVAINTEIRYKTDAKCIQLKSFFQFEDRGIVHELSDIKKFEQE